ncbi:MAG: 2-phospho-L-lactate transferase CofD family protein [Casimicrobium sp.]
MLNVVVLNGGRGAAALIPALLARQGLQVTSIVNAYDDGKSTGLIRRFFGMLGPSDIRKVQELMLPADDVDYLANLQVFCARFAVDCPRGEALSLLRSFANGSRDDLVGARFESQKVRLALRRFVNEFLDGLNVIERVNGEEFSFYDCSVMNCIYAGAFLVFKRNIEDATIFIDKLFKLRGTVLPTSIEDKKLVALRENGEMLYSEAEIVELRSNVRVERIYLLDQLLDPTRFASLNVDEKRTYLAQHHCFVPASQGVRRALQQADIIIYSAGTQHSSLYPTYLSAGVAEAIADNKSAFKVFVTNIGADYETPTYKASDYICGAHRYLNMSDARSYSMEELFDADLINRSRLKADETYVEFDLDGFDKVPTRRIVDAFESASSPGKHDGSKVVETVLSLYESITSRGPRS